jgi:hypothetical protein
MEREQSLIERRLGWGRIGLSLSSAALLLTASSAFADGVPVTITNDGTEDIVVTVYDTTVGPRNVILSQRMNSFSTVPLYMSPDSTGRANLSWTAVTVDPRDRRCGHADQQGVSDSAQINVHADSACAAT